MALGYRNYGGKGVVCKKEQLVVDKILTLRGEGLTPYGIAQRLNREGVPTKRRKGPWQHHAVKEMLIRLEKSQAKSLHLQLTGGKIP